MAVSTLSITLSNPHLLPSFPKPISYSKNLSFPPLSSSLNSNEEPSTSSSSSHVGSVPATRRRLLQLGSAILGSNLLGSEANATRIEYYATVGEPLCDMSFARSGLGYCDIVVGSGVQPPPGELINIHYTARFADGMVFDSSYKRGRPLTMRIGAGKVLPGLDQGILGGGGVPPMHVGGKRKLMIPPKLAYGPEPAGCFSGDCNIPGNATLLYDILFVGVYK